jgi:CDP-diacylglycerol--serine O-phosphatidyltransferase
MWGLLWLIDPEVTVLRHFLNPPNWFTSASLFCGLYAIVLATGVEGDPNFYRASLMILFAAVFDMLDGRVARMTGRGTDFGIQLDSLADMVSFGIAPAVVLYAWGIHSLGTVGLIGAFVFALCGAFRLARFNCGADGTKHDHSEGLTITMAGATVAAAVMAHATSGRTMVEHPWNVWVLSMILGFLMVSQVPYRSAKSLKLSRERMMLLALVFGIVLAIAVKYRFPTAFIVVLGSYVLSGPLEAIFRRRRVEVVPEEDLVAAEEEVMDKRGPLG